MTSILVVALALVLIGGPPLFVDLYRFAAREWDWYWFRRHMSGEFDQHLRSDWRPSEIARLQSRLIKRRDR